jgi:uncharacterized protein YbgA (DUF1722 family)
MRTPALIQRYTHPRIRLSQRSFGEHWSLLTLLRPYVERLKIASLHGQAYLDLHPKELMLRNQL